jgi:hypothetical protein
MKGFFKRFETVMAAAAFAEEGEAETARQILNEQKQQRKTDRPSSYSQVRPAKRPEVRAE